ncbi:MAG: hypothetical protein ACJ8LV_05810 [Chthoniobacterales bacterium]
MMSDYSKKFIVKPGSKVRLKHFDAGYHGKRESHERALPEIQQHIEKMAQLHYLMYAERKDSLLVVLQGLHAAGEDGVVRHIFTTGGATIPTKRMKILLASVFLYLACTAGPAAFAAEKVGFITVDGAIGPATASYISRSIEEAKGQKCAVPADSAQHAGRSARFESENCAKLPRLSSSSLSSCVCASVSHLLESFGAMATMRRLNQELRVCLPRLEPSSVALATVAAPALSPRRKRCQPAN